MSLSISSFAWLFFISGGLFIAGRILKDYTIGILGGFTIFILGLYVLIENLSGIEVWFSNVVGSVLFGIGVYIFVVGSIELSDKYDSGA